MKGTAATAAVAAVLVALVMLVKPALPLPHIIPDPGVPAATSAPAPASAPTPDASFVAALPLLDGLQVKGRAPKTGYSRDLFLPGGWPSIGSGCDLRDQILARDLIPGTRTDVGCNIVSGEVNDPYSGQRRAVLATDIEHIVALFDAWQKGAQQLTVQQRQQLATDPDNLIAVDAGLNRQKRDADAATWLPPNKAWRCDYAARQVVLKDRYDLWVTPAEHDALSKILHTCIERPQS